MNKEDYINKKLSRYYRRKISKRSLDLSREECDKQYGIGDFFHLNVHSKFSILGGVNDPLDLFEEAKKQNMSGLAITETGFLSSIPDCYNASTQTNLKYLPGICAYFSDYEITRRKIVESDTDDIKNHQALLFECRPFRTPLITIIAKNQEGYKELLNINTESWTDGYYYVPKVNREILKKYANGNLIILSGNLIDKFIEFGYIFSTENNYNALSAYGYANWFHETFGKDFFIETVMRCQDTVWGSDLDRLITTTALLNKIKSEGKTIQTVLTNDVRYIDRKHAYLNRAMVAISRNSTLKRIRDYSDELYFKTKSELLATYDRCLYKRAINLNDFQTSCDNTLKIAEQCQTFIADTKPKLPEINNADEILKKSTIQQLISKGLHKNKTKYEVDGNMVTYFEQVKIELDRFIEKGFSSYFLIMQDLIKHSHDLGWQIGPARGSSAGSLVCYLLGITSMDPIKFKLSFNRFLSPSRGGYMLKVSMD